MNYSTQFVGILVSLLMSFDASFISDISCIIINAKGDTLSSNLHLELLLDVYYRSIDAEATRCSFIWDRSQSRAPAEGHTDGNAITAIEHRD